MKRLENIKSMEELLSYKKELETIITDEDLLEEVVENVWKELLNVNGYINTIYNYKNPNRKWIAIILTILNSRSYKEHYKIRIINTCNSKEKLYTFSDDLHHITVEEVNADKESNVVLFTNGKENSVIYDRFKGKLDIDSYLEAESELSKVIDYVENKGLSEKEISLLSKFVFDSYKENISKGKIRTRKCE